MHACPKGLKDAARRARPPASRIRPTAVCVSACVRTRRRHRRAHTRRRGRGNRWLRVAAGESSTRSARTARTGFFCAASRDHGLPRSFQATHCFHVIYLSRLPSPAPTPRGSHLVDRAARSPLSPTTTTTKLFPLRAKE